MIFTNKKEALAALQNGAQIETHNNGQSIYLVRPGGPTSRIRYSLYQNLFRGKQIVHSRNERRPPLKLSIGIWVSKS